ncbi:MAG: DNA-processing protein DprA [Planctomycetota bacterium]|jgi:DNA processing protein
MDAVEDVIRLASCPGLGPKLFKNLKQHFGSVMEILSSSERSLTEVSGIGNKLAAEIVKSADYDPRPEMEAAAAEDVEILIQDSPLYPASLRSTYDPPIMLYIKGKLVPNDTIAIAVVGTRKSSQYAKIQTEKYTSLLSRTGFTIVSGLARGIDTYAHKATLAVGGRTIAVLGSGLLNIYPEENRDIAAEIAGNGAVISEFPIHTAPAKENFPRRNRIIAGLSLGTLVIEAPRRSGAVITANFANDLGREVFAIPGRVDNPAAEGTNTLIKNGNAKLIQNLEDILIELGPLSDDLLEKADEIKKGLKNNTASEAAAPEPEGTDAKIISILTEEPTHIDEICAKTGLPVNQVSSSLMMLELKRRIRSQPGKFYTV